MFFSQIFIGHPRVAFVISILIAFGGMLAAIVEGIIFVPAHYCVFQRLRETLKGKSGKDKEATT